MAIRVAKFQIGKDRKLEDLNRFLSEQGLRSANILHVQVSQLGRDRVEYILTYEDNTNPFVVLTIPSDGDTTVGPGATITAIFSEPIQNISVTDIEIFNLTTSTVVPTSHYLVDNSDAADIPRGIIRIQDAGAPSSQYLLDQNAYRITFKTTIKDLAGNNMEEAHDIIIAISRGLNAITLDGGRVSAFTNPSLNRWEAIVTPVRISFGELTDLQLSMRGDEGSEFDAFNVHYEPLVAPSGSFRIVLEHGNRLITPEPTGILPSGMAIDWLAANGLL
jgi:hypothetical protein